MSRKPEFGGHFLRPAVINEIQIMTASSRIDLVSQYWKADGCQMHPDLMRATRLRPGLQHGKGAIPR
jgi:hypothetical protein